MIVSKEAAVAEVRRLREAAGVFLCELEPIIRTNLPDQRKWKRKDPSVYVDRMTLDRDMRKSGVDAQRRWEGAGVTVSVCVELSHGRSWPITLPIFESVSITVEARPYRLMRRQTRVFTLSGMKGRERVTRRLQDSIPAIVAHIEKHVRHAILLVETYQQDSDARDHAQREAETAWRAAGHVGDVSRAIDGVTVRLTSDQFEQMTRKGRR